MVGTPIWTSFSARAAAPTRPGWTAASRIAPLKCSSLGHSFLIQQLDLLHQSVDFFRTQFARVVRHVAFAAADDVAQLVAGRGFGGSERRSAKAAACGCFAVTLRAV